MNRLVALCVPGGPGYVGELRRAFDDGDAVLPLDLRLSPGARRRLVETMRPSVLVEDGRREQLHGGIPVEPGDALVMPTSGTTGDPKGVVLTHSAVEASARATSARLGVDASQDRWWACLPMAHIGGLSVVLRSMVAAVSCEVDGGFSVEGAARALERGATLTSLVPTALSRLPAPLRDGFRRIVLGGQAPPSELPANVVTTYGMTETGSGVVYDGVPLDGVGVRITDGEIELRGPMLMRGYRDGTDPLRDGWLPTGDGGEIGADGRLVVNGRLGDLVISGGENVWPATVEPILERHPAVGEAAVGGRPDPEWGERVTAYLVLPEAQEPVDAAVLLAELRELVRSELAGYAAPREIVLVESLPRTPLGKVRRDALQDLGGPSAGV